MRRRFIQAHSRAFDRRDGGYSVVELMVGFAILGIAVAGLMSGQEMLAQLREIREQRMTAWSLRRQFEAQAFDRIRELMNRSVDHCRPCATSLPIYFADRSRETCLPLRRALDTALSNEAAPSYSLRLRLVNNRQILPRWLAHSSFRDAYERCVSSQAFADAGATKSGYACFALEMPADGGSDLSEYLATRTIFAEVSTAFLDMSRNQPLTCTGWSRLEADERGLQFFYTLYTVERRKQGFFTKIHGAFTARSAP